MTTTIYGVAAPPGFEPEITDSESVVLPIILRGNIFLNYSSDYFFFLLIFAHVSRKDTMRLNTSFSLEESLSTQKYPNRSNW